MNINELNVVYDDGDVYAHIVEGERLDPDTDDVWTVAYCGTYICANIKLDRLISDEATGYDPEKFDFFDAPGICPLCWLAAAGGKRIVYAMQDREVSNES